MHYTIDHKENIKRQEKIGSNFVNATVIRYRRWLPILFLNIGSNVLTIKYIFNFKNKYKFIEDTNKMSVYVFKQF